MLPSDKGYLLGRWVCLIDLSTIQLPLAFGFYWVLLSDPEQKAALIIRPSRMLQTVL